MLNRPNLPTLPTTFRRRAGREDSNCSALFRSSCLAVSSLFKTYSLNGCYGFNVCLRKAAGVEPGQGIDNTEVADFKKGEKGEKGQKGKSTVQRCTKSSSIQLRRYPCSASTNLLLYAVRRGIFFGVLPVKNSVPPRRHPFQRPLPGAKADSCFRLAAPRDVGAPLLRSRIGAKYQRQTLCPNRLCRTSG